MSREHQQFAFTPQPDRISEARELLEAVAERVTSKLAENGPSSWCASVSEDGQQFFVEALFESQEAIEFHQANIADLFVKFEPLLAAPPEINIRSVIAAAG